MKIKAILPALLAIAASGCSTSGLDRTYGKVRSVSVNGTGAFAGSLRERGHQVRTFSRLGTRLDDWADAIVRFAPMPGPPDKNEAQWYDRWLDAAPNRLVVYIPYDFDAAHEYWSRLLNDLPADAAPRTVERVTDARDKSANWASQPRVGVTAAPSSDDVWFKVEGPKGTALTHKTLGGPWGEGLDAAKVALPNRSSLKPGNEDVLLSADGLPLAIDWDRHNLSRVLVLANGAFLLNEPMTEPARLPLASRVADWITWDDVSDVNRLDAVRAVPKKVAFVEGRFVTVDKTKPKDSDHRLEIQLGLLGLAACLAAAPRLGRARPEAPSGADRPVAHPEALGALLARTGRASEARGMLETYRRWRFRTGLSTRISANESAAAPAPRAEPPKNPYDIG